MRVVVTGGAGFIGSHLSRRLAEKGNDVTIIDDFRTGIIENCAGLKVVEGDICDSAVLNQALRGAEVVYHMAAELGVERIVGRDEEVWRVEVEGTRNVLRACVAHDVQRVLLASSSEVYGYYPKHRLPMAEGDNVVPDTLYGKAKRSGEILGSRFLEKYGLHIIVVRYFNVYGPKQTRGGFVVPAFVHSLLSGQNIRIHGDGSQTRDFTFLDDAVDATIRVCRDEFNGQIFNIGSGRPTSMNELAHKLMGLSGTRSGIEYGPPRRPTDIHDKYADIAKIRKVVGWCPVTGLDEGLRLTVESYARTISDRGLAYSI